MRSVVDTAEAFSVHVAVDLRRRERRVSEELLDRAEVGASFEEMSGKRVSEAVWMR